MPERLQVFITNVKKELESKYKGDKTGKTALTGQKLNDELRERFENQARDYKDEIKWIKKCWWYRIYGKWFFNYGKPIFLSGTQWFYLNQCYMVDSTTKDNLPEFRITDWKLFHAVEYAEKTTETFAKIDSNGMAIPEEDGSYEMKDIGIRTLIGMIYPKNRRDGATYKGLTIVEERTTRTKGAKSGIQSYTCANAEGHFRDKLVPMWQELPFYFKPIWEGNNAPAAELSFTLPSNKPIGTALRSFIDYAMTADSSYYNGGPLYWSLMDEEGQQGNVPIDVRGRWEVNRKCHQQGLYIRGFSFHPSTVNEMKKGGKPFLELYSNSNFYQRKSDGSTISGLMAMFKPGYECREGCVGKYGESIEEMPTELQVKNGYRLDKGAKILLDEEIKLAKKKGVPIDGIIAAQPRDLDDVFRSVGGNIGMDTEIIDKRRLDLSSMDSEPVRRYSLDWTNGFGSDVKERYDPVNGLCLIKDLPPTGVRNKRYYQIETNPITIGSMKTWYSQITGRYMLGVDTYKTTGRKSESGLSKGAGSLFDKENNCFQLVYLGRRDVMNEFYEDMLKIAIFYGAKIFPETNVLGFTDWVYMVGFGGYFHYKMDVRTGKKSDMPGMNTNVQSKENIFKENREYIKTMGSQEVFDEYLEQCSNVKSFDDMTYNDLFTSCGLALVGIHSDYTEEIQKARGEAIVLSGSFFMPRYY